MATDAEHARELPGVGGSTAAAWSRQTKAFAVRNLRTMLRTKATIVWGFGFPAFWYLLTSNMMLPSAGEVGGAAVLADIKGATAVSLGLFGVLTTTLVAFAGGLSTDIDQKRYRKFRSLPVAPSADFVGRYLAGLVVAGIAYTIVLVVGAVDGADYALRSPASVGVVLGSFLLFSLVGVSVAVLVTRVVTDPEMVVGVTNGILLVSYFLTGYNGLSPRLLPEATRGVVNVAPNALAARIQLYHLTETAGMASPDGAGVTPPALPTGPEHVGLLAVWALVLGAAGAAAMDWSVYSGEGGE